MKISFYTTVRKIKPDAESSLRTALSTVSTAWSTALLTSLTARSELLPSYKILEGEHRKGPELATLSFFVHILGTCPYPVELVLLNLSSCFSLLMLFVLLQGI